MENFADKLIKMTKEGGFTFQSVTETKLTPERKQIIYSFIGDREDFTSIRKFEYELPSEIHQSFYIDTVQIYLFSNKTCLLLWDLGDIDHNSNDHRVGIYEETADAIKTKTISVWRDSESVEENVFTKKSDNTLLYDDTNSSVWVQEKILVFKN
jgi:hypothetical protein